METFGRRTRMILTRATIVLSMLMIGTVKYGPAQRATSNLVEVPLTKAESAAGTYKIKGLNTSAEVKIGKGIRITMLGRAGSKILDLADVLQKFSDARIFNDRVIVIAGLFSGDVSRIVIVDMKTGLIIDKFFCYAPSISPDGKYIVFIKFYPAHGVSSVEDHYAVYDSARSPADNRPRAGRTDAATVGDVFYPRATGNQEGDNVDITGRPLHQMSGEKFFWMNDAKGFVFADRYGDDLRAVSVIILKGKPQVHTLQIDLADLCGTESSCVQRLVDVRFLDAKKASLTFRDFSGRSTKAQEILLTLAQDRPH
jgi:hypothetical protein